MTPSKELREGAAYSDLGTATAPINKVIMARPIRIRSATQRRRTGTMSVAVDGDEPSGGRRLGCCSASLAMFAIEHGHRVTLLRHPAHKPFGSLL